MSIDNPTNAAAPTCIGSDVTGLGTIGEGFIVTSTSIVRRLIAAMLFVAAAASCSSSHDTIRSDNGPDAHDSTSTTGSKVSTEKAKAANPTTSPALTIVGNIHVPDGEEGKLSIVTIGTQADDKSVPIIIRNRTSKTLHNLEATGTARGADGALIGSGSSQEIAPANLAPGEWAMGFVFFSATLPAGAKYDLTVKGDSEQGGIYDDVDLKAVETNITKGDDGPAVVGIVKNDTDTEVNGPVSVLVGCFDQAGTALLSTTTGFTEGGDSVPAGGTASFSVNLFDHPCVVYAVGSSGYTS